MFQLAPDLQSSSHVMFRLMINSRDKITGAGGHGIILFFSVVRNKAKEFGPFGIRFHNTQHEHGHNLKVSNEYNLLVTNKT